ncbi:MAG: hypothetical protein BWK80_10205, partial [Desulfobacteraceae bacterium IS3]
TDIPLTAGRFGEHEYIRSPVTFILIIRAFREDNHGGSRIRVRGSAKIMTQLMSGLIVITAIQLIRLTVQLQYDKEHPVCLTSGKRVKAEVFPFFAFLTEC